MSAPEVLKAARDAGIGLHVDGDELVLEASAPPPAAVLDLLKCHKAGVIKQLREGDECWSAEDWLAFFDERAGIAKFKAGLPRPAAEACAFACCVSEWRNRNPMRSPPGRCLGCGRAENAHDPLLPFGTEATGHTWLHHRCWSAWQAGRKAQAVAALAAKGIENRRIHS